MKANITTYAPLAVAAALVAVLVSGCATATLNPDRVASSKSAIRSAQELGAVDVPQAQLHLRLAQEELAQAEKLMEDGDSERAELFLQRANLDAELALALVKEASAKAEATDAVTALAKIKGNTP